jgi:hypothetical protein
MRYFGLPFLAIAVQNQAKFECNSTTPNNRNTLSNCINLTAAAILSSKQISQPKAVFFTNNTGTLSMIAQILKVIVLKETLYLITLLLETLNSQRHRDSCSLLYCAATFICHGAVNFIPAGEAGRVHRPQHPRFGRLFFDRDHFN